LSQDPSLVLSPRGSTPSCSSATRQTDGSSVLFSFRLEAMANLRRVATSALVVIAAGSEGVEKATSASLVVAAVSEGLDEEGGEKYCAEEGSGACCWSRCSPPDEETSKARADKRSFGIWWVGKGHGPFATIVCQADAKKKQYPEIITETTETGVIISGQRFAFGDWKEEWKEKHSDFKDWDGVQCQHKDLALNPTVCSWKHCFTRSSSYNSDDSNFIWKVGEGPGDGCEEDAKDKQYPHTSKTETGVVIYVGLGQKKSVWMDEEWMNQAWKEQKKNIQWEHCYLVPELKVAE